MTSVHNGSVSTLPVPVHSGFASQRFRFTVVPVQCGARQFRFTAVPVHPGPGFGSKGVGFSGFGSVQSHPDMLYSFVFVYRYMLIPALPSAAILA